MNHRLEQGGSAVQPLQLCAYNAAFYELGLRWHWDGPTYQGLLATTGGVTPVRSYVETAHPHLLHVYDIDFLVDLIQATMERCHETIVASATRRANPVDWAAMQVAQLGF